MVVYAIAAVIAAAGLYFLLRGFVGANPASLAKLLRGIGITLGVLLILFFAVTGRLPAAIALAAALAPMLLRWRAILNRFKAARGPSAGNSSAIRTAWLHVMLDHDSGAMQGEVIAGPMQGAQLDDLSQTQLETLLAQCQSADPQGARVLETYIDRRFGHGASGAQPGGGAQAASDGPMTVDRARDILGVAANASAEEIRAAHRRLMKHIHPDQGGSDWLAAQVNQAKDLLLGS